MVDGYKVQNKQAGVQNIKMHSHKFKDNIKMLKIYNVVKILEHYTFFDKKF